MEGFSKPIFEITMETFNHQLNRLTFRCIISIINFGSCRQGGEFGRCWNVKLFLGRFLTQFYGKFHQHFLKFTRICLNLSEFLNFSNSRTPQKGRHGKLGLTIHAK